MSPALIQPITVPDLVEQVYARFGRSRLLAYWTVLSTLVRVQATKRMVRRGR